MKSVRNDVILFINGKALRRLRGYINLSFNQKCLTIYFFLKTILIIIFLSSSILSIAQPNKRVVHWYQPRYIGLDFTSGMPIEDSLGQAGLCFVYCPNGSSVMSDTSGNLLFYSDGRYVWNKNHEIMSGVVGWLGIQDYWPGSQGALCLKKPNSENIFYVFSVRDNNYPYPMFYYTIDMSLNGGLGDIIDTTHIQGRDGVAEKIASAYHHNKQDIWIVTRDFNTDSYTSFLLNSNGLNPTPVMRPAPDRDLFEGPDNWGHSKFSYNKKYFVSCFYGANSQDDAAIEICSFNDITGEITFLYSFKLQEILSFPMTIAYNLEFSPDSKFLYLGGYTGIDTTVRIFQFDMKFIEDKNLFLQSSIIVGQGQGFNLQLAPDGKIYCLAEYPAGIAGLGLDKTYGIIHQPQNKGLACDYEPNAYEFSHGELYFPGISFMTDYLLRFDFEGQCALDTFYFDPWFFPTPTWIQWDFGDTASGSQNISNELHSKHAFTHGGEFEVSVLLTYPSGRVEKTSRVVEVDSVPFPNLGPDTLICRDASLTLSAGCNAQFFTWSTGQWGTTAITVSDTGYYWVRASYANGCDNYDTIHVGFLPETLFDEINLLLTPTACGGTSGSITGLQINGIEPLFLEWKDLSGLVLGNSNDLLGLGVGQYYLEVTDGNGCTAESPMYTITDAGNLQVDSVSVSGAICGQGNGVIQVYATPQPGGQLLYSINNGDNFFDNGGLFENLSPADYVVMIKDLNDCEGVYTYNPVSVADLAAPDIISAITLSEIDFLQNGEIILEAMGNTPDLLYSIDNGSSWQTNNGTFTGLSAGIYNCIVRDENNCDTAFQLEVTRFWATILQAIAGSTDTCTGTTFEIPLLVEHFNDVSKFRMHLSYNKDMMDCLGYTGAEPSLEDSLQVFINEASGDILVTWQGLPPVTLPDQAPVVDIIFTDKGVGQGTIDWYGQAQESYFVKSTADTLAAAFITGTVRISSPPSITGLSDMTLCEGEELLTFAMVQGSNPITEQHWLWPDGSTHPGPGLMLFEVEPGQSGTYTFVATDSRGCTSEESMNLTVIPTPDPALPNGDTLTPGAGQTLDAGSGFSSYVWNTGETAQAITPAADGWYKVTVTSTNNCQGTDSVYVLIQSEEIPSQYFYIPNAFTPDGDGKNDVFKPVLANPELSIVDFRLSIFDRWGGLIFEGDGISAGWDGTKNGVQCPGGVYVYRITFRVDGDSEEQVIVGTVAVVR